MHLLSSLTVLLVIAFMIWNTRRRLNRVRKRADHWFQPSGENFIYQPRGRWGHAFIVSAADRETIKRKMASLWVVVFSGLTLVYVVPLLLAASDMDHYLDYRRLLIGYRLGAISVILIAALIWHRLTIWPIYASAERSAQRISVRSVHSKVAADISWAMLTYRVVFFVFLLACLATGVWFQRDSLRVILTIAGGLFCVWGLVQAIRLAITKSRR